MCAALLAAYQLCSFDLTLLLLQDVSATPQSATFSGMARRDGKRGGASEEASLEYAWGCLQC